jgi:hypothetical protein
MDAMQNFNVKIGAFDFMIYECRANALKIFTVNQIQLSIFCGEGLS